MSYFLSVGSCQNLRLRERSEALEAGYARKRPHAGSGASDVMHRLGGRRSRLLCLGGVCLEAWSMPCGLLSVHLSVCPSTCDILCDVVEDSNFPGKLHFGAGL